MRLLITGVAGFLGSHLADRLVADGHEVSGLDDLSNGLLSNVASARRRKGFGFHQFDVTSPLLGQLVGREEPAVVIHLAPVLPAAVLAAAASVGARVVLASSAAVYGSVRVAVSERRGAHPTTLAGAAAAAAEAYGHAYVAQGLPVVTLRFATVYGPRSRGVVTTWARALQARKPTYVLGDGKVVRDLVHVDDAVDAVLRCLGGKGDGRRLNIGTGRGTTVRALHAAVAAAVGAPDAPEFRPARPEDLASVLLDPGAARRALGWEPHVGLTEGIARTLDALRKH
jgi:UDP-glucose 4-epimerase